MNIWQCWRIMVTNTDIQTAHPQTRFQEITAPVLYIADFTRRTQNTSHPRSVEISTLQPTMDDCSVVDAVTFHNDNKLNVEIATFDDHIYLDTTGTNIEHCEGCLYVKNTPKWITLYEIKDCDEANILNHRAKAIRQITNVSDDLKLRSIITVEKVYGIISFPRKHTAFNDDIFGDIIEYTRLKRNTGILFYATNEVFIVNHDELSPVEL